uniref:Thioredoxin domain-containing protein n=1 Tax=Leersia perrieri TaxID=77586 RepID=A0A0D9XGT5_9ORYZ
MARTMDKMAMLAPIQKHDEYYTFRDKAAENKCLMVVEFISPRSVPCKEMERPFKDMITSKFQNNNKVLFYTADLNNLVNLARELESEGAPSFVLVKDKAVKKHMVITRAEKLPTLQKEIERQLEDI